MYVQYLKHFVTITPMFDLSPKIKKWLKFALKGLLVLVIFGLLAWFFVINPYLIRQEKKRFETASASLKQLSEEIQTKIGKANEVIRSETCGYASAKFERGARSCAVTTKLTYLSADLNKSNEFLSTISEYIGGVLYPGAGNFEQTQFEDVPRAEQSFTQEFYKSGYLCKIAYQFTDISKLKVAHNDKTDGLLLSLNCSGSAEAEHFPVEN